MSIVTVYKHFCISAIHDHVIVRGSWHMQIYSFKITSLNHFWGVKGHKISNARHSQCTTFPFGDLYHALPRRIRAAHAHVSASASAIARPSTVYEPHAGLKGRRARWVSFWSIRKLRTGRYIDLERLISSNEDSCHRKFVRNCMRGRWD